jgi:hypothetical protein
MNTTQSPSDEELRWIDVLLEEASGQAAREPEQRRWLLAAALMLLGLSAVVAALLAPRREPPQPAQEPASVKETCVDPKDGAELRALLATLRSVQVRCRRLQSMDSSSVSFAADPATTTVIADPETVARWSRALRDSAGKEVTLKAIGRSVELRLSTTDGRLLMASAVLDPVAGMFFGSRTDAHEPTEPMLALLRAAERDADHTGRKARGIAANLAELAAFPDRLTEVACPALNGAQVRTVLARFSQLQSLTLIEQPGVAVPDAQTLPALAHLTTLRDLTLVGGSFDGQAMRELEALELRRLSVMGCTSFDAASIEVVSKWKTLAELGLTGVPAAGDPEALATLKSFPALRRLSLQAPALTDECLEHLLTTRLQALSVGGGAQLTGKGLARLAGLPSLRELELCGLPRGSVPLLGAMPMIGRLFQGVGTLDDADVDELVKLRQLRRLDLRDTRIGPEASARLREQLPECKVRAEPGQIGNFAQVLTGQF